jgi:AraC-like DNA-binding protein
MMEREYTNKEIADLIELHIHSERDRKILKRRLIDGIRFEPLAEEVDMSVRHIKRIVYKAQDKLFRYIK